MADFDGHFRQKGPSMMDTLTDIDRVCQSQYMSVNKK